MAAPEETTATRSKEIEIANETTGFNLIPFAVMAGGWLGPVAMFWLYVWGPLRPFHYPPGDVAPSMLAVAISVAACLSIGWVPHSYYQANRFERTGRFYEAMGVRIFRRFVPDGDHANRWKRRHAPEYRVIRNRSFAAAFVRRTELSERGHLVLLAVGLLSVTYALAIGWWGWALYIGVGNVIVNLYPVLLQRYTRNRIQLILNREPRWREAMSASPATP
jgi:hypothetical protein